MNQANPTPPIITNNAPRLIGIVAHDLLQWICDHHPKTIAEIPWELAIHQFKTFGFVAPELQTAQNQLMTQLTQLFDDPIGQWFIKTHDNERNEYELIVEDHNGITTKIIDRTFCENGIRWIIDFKTGHDDNNAVTHHQEQVNDYARLFRNQGHESIYCGLYYLASTHWVAWEHIN